MPKIKEFTNHVRLGNKTVMTGVSVFKGKPYFNLRYLYQDDSGDLLPSKNGISIPLSDAVDAVKVMIEAIGKVTGLDLRIVNNGEPLSEITELVDIDDPFDEV